MALLDLTYSSAHKLKITKTRGKGVSGGWRRIPRCSCGWNGNRGIHGSMFSSSFASDEQAELAHIEHLGETDATPETMLGRMTLTLRHQSFQEPMKGIEL